jgi:transcriptional regulator with XRE-family HTH domain
LDYSKFDFILVSEIGQIMEKSVFSTKYRLFLRTLRDARKRYGLTQQQLAEKLGQTQSFISKCERGERRIDVVELRAICKAIGISFTEFTTKLNAELDRKGQ